MLALTLSTAFLVSRLVAAASVKARSERDICGAVPVPFVLGGTYAGFGQLSGGSLSHVKDGFVYP